MPNPTETAQTVTPQRIGNFNVVFCNPPAVSRGRPNIYAPFFRRMVTEHPSEWAKLSTRFGSRQKALGKADAMKVNFKRQVAGGHVPDTHKMRTRVRQTEQGWYVWIQFVEIV